MSLKTNKHAALLDAAAPVPIPLLLRIDIDILPNQTMTATAATICIPMTTARSFSMAVVDLASFAGTPDGNMNSFELVPSAACAAPIPVVAVGPLLAVIRDPLSSYDGGADGAAGSMVTKTGNPCSSHLVTTSRPEAEDETDPSEEEDCAGVGWKSDCTRIQVSIRRDRS